MSAEWTTCLSVSDGKDPVCIAVSSIKISSMEEVNVFDHTRVLLLLLLLFIFLFYFFLCGEFVMEAPNISVHEMYCLVMYIGYHFKTEHNDLHFCF